MPTFSPTVLHVQLVSSVYSDYQQGSYITCYDPTNLFFYLQFPYIG